MLLYLFLSVVRHSLETDKNFGSKFLFLYEKEGGYLVDVLLVCRVIYDRVIYTKCASSFTLSKKILVAS